MRPKLLTVLLAACAFQAAAEVRLPHVLGSHMVLQRDRPIHIWGWASPGEPVSVEFLGNRRDATAGPLGQWSVYLPPAPAGGPHQLTVSGANRVVLDDVLIGDVWFASGQSNMEMPLSGFPGSPVEGGVAEIARAANPRLRLLTVPHASSDFPLRDVKAAWAPSSPETAADFSAVAYFFGRDLAARYGVPIGLIDSTWGGTPAEAWTSLGGLSADASLMPVFRARARMMQDQADVEAILAAQRAEDEAARKAGRPAPEHPWRPEHSSWKPAGLFNAMVAPFTPFAIKGVIWYQGESNTGAGFAPTYERLFPALIADWRREWQLGDFPFLFVQLSDFQTRPPDRWPIVREAQRRTLSTANTAMAVTIDVGDPKDIHPANKKAVAGRLVLAARALAYGERLEYSGPLFRQAAPESGAMRIWFHHTAGGLQAKGGDLQGFEVAGEDGRFVPASARIDRDTVVATAPEVAAPKYVRYAWSSSPRGANLGNSAGLPASPFTSQAEIPVN